MNSARHTRLIALLFFLGIAPSSMSIAEETSDSRTVLGQRNAKLADGAQALRDGDAEEGIRLTLLGLAAAQGRRERQAALGNLCAGYLLLRQFDEAIDYCDQALEESDRNWRVYNNRALVYLELKRFDDAKADIARGQELAPNAKSLKIVKGMLLDETNPVSPIIVIDDRREPADDES
jgi:tetratricopeptide (TPR) repeat protein